MGNSGLSGFIKTQTKCWEQVINSSRWYPPQMGKRGGFVKSKVVDPGLNFRREEKEYRYTLLFSDGGASKSLALERNA